MGETTPKQKVILIIGATLVVVLILGLLGFIPIFKRTEPQLESQLTVWGVFDTSATWEPIFNTFSEQTGTTFVYKMIPFDDYERDLLNAFANRAGPDIFMLHNSWLPAYQDRITPMPQTRGFMTFKDFQDTFVFVAEQDFTRNSAQIYGMPLYMDTLGLYYNRDLLNSAGRSDPPSTWESFQDLVSDLTHVDASGSITQAGAAIGTADNINRSTDVFSLLMLQRFYPIDPVSRDVPQSQLMYSLSEGGKVNAPGMDALRFYTDFANPVLSSYTWNRDMPYSIDAFIDGRAAMMLNYSHHIKTIRSRAPELNFGVGRAPQPQELVAMNIRVDYPSYFGFSVSKFSTPEKQDIAWRFLNYLSEAGPQAQYAQATDRVPVRKDLLGLLQDDPDYAIFAQAALTARSWYQPNATLVEQYLADMINSVLDGTTVREALERVEGQINVLIRRDR